LNRTKLIDRTYAIASILGFVALWEALSAIGLLNKDILPPPHAFLKEAFDQRQFDVFRLSYAGSSTKFALVNATLSSLARVLAGIALGFGLGIACGGFMVYFKCAERLILPVLTLFAPISPIAWIPFAMIALGIGNKAAVFVVVIAVFFLIAIGTVTSIRNVEPIYIKTARTLGATRWQVFYHVLIPATLPSLFIIVRLNLFAAWMSVLAAEMVGVAQGLGAMVMVGRALFNVKMIFLAMTLIGICGLLLDSLLLAIQKKVLWWRVRMPY
jgi:NitT/TauT family transport system permease protein